MKSRMLEKRCLHIAGVLAIFIFGCTKNERSSVIRPPEWSDPYLQAFRGKNIRYAISERRTNEDVYNDTIEFDRQGNLIRIHQPFHREILDYDSAGFLVKSIGWSYDVYYSHVTRYRPSGDTLFVVQREYDYDIPRDMSDTTAFRIRREQFTFDSNGRVLEKSDSEGNVLIEYKYENNNLAQIVAHGNLDDNDSTIYSYDKNSILIKITALKAGGTLEILYYSSGLLDSTFVRNPANKDYDRMKYRYIHY